METIDIKTYNGTTIKTVAVSVEAESHETLMADDYITLVWNDETGDELPAGAYVTDDNGEKYTLLDPYTPEQVSEGEWRYQPQFSSRVAAWSKVPYFHYTRIGSTVTNREPDWTLTDTAENFIKNIAAAITEETGEYWTGESSFELSGIQNISFQSTDIFSGLNAIADAFETEWRADKSTNTVYLGKAMFTGASTPTLEVGVNINVPSVTLNKEGFYNRFVVFGSTRNITQDYEGANVNNLVNKRLTLNPTQYPGSVIDRRTSASEPKLTKILIFDDIYPKSNLVVIDARPRLMYAIKKGTADEKIQIGTDANGEPIYDQYAIWYLQLGTKDTSGNVTPFRLANKQPYNKDNPDGVLIPGKNLSIHFSSGALNGREFEVQYCDETKTVQSFDGTPFEVKEGDFEITYTEDNNFIVPAMVGSVPDDGDKVILFNLRMPPEYITEAYSELKQAADITIAEYESDRNNYEFDSNPVEFDGNAALLGLRVGQKVIYKNGDYSYATRILSITRKLDHPFEQTIKVGNDRIKGDTRTLKEEVANANKDINLIATFNQLTQSTINNYNKMLTEITAGFERIKDMWRFDPEHPDVIFTKYTAYSLKDLQAFGYSNNGEGGGEGGGNGGAVFNLLLNWNDYTSDKDNNYAISAKLGYQLYTDLSQLQADALTRAVADTLYQPKGDYASGSDFEALAQRVTDFLDGTDTDTIINRWKELEAFLSGLSQTDNLAAILSNKVDKVDGYGLSQNDFTDALLSKLNGIEDGANKYIHPLDGNGGKTILPLNGSVLSAITVNALGHVTSVSSKALTEADIPDLSISKITNLQTSLNAKLDKNEFKKWFEIIYDTDGQTILYIKTPHTFVSDKDLQAFGYDNQGGSQYTAALADLTDVTLTNPASGQALVYNGTRWVNQTINVSGGLDETQLAAYLTANNYAKKSDIPSLTGYATQSWVTSQNYLTSQAIRTLTIQKNGTTVDTFDPTATANKTINIADVASAATLSSHIGNTTIHITADERTLWNKTATDLASIWGTDSDLIINKWQEVVNFLSGMGEADNLALILASKANKTDLDAYLKISEFEKYFKAIKNADGSISYILTPHTLVSEKDLQAFGQSDAQGSGGSANINMLTSWANYSDATKGYAPTAEIVKAALDSKLEASALNGYALKSEIPSLSGYATQDWVNQNYVTVNTAQTISGQKIFARPAADCLTVKRTTAGGGAFIDYYANNATDFWRVGMESGGKFGFAWGSVLTNAAIDSAGNMYATKFVKSGGTSSQFLKADGSVDSNSYALSSALDSYLRKDVQNFKSDGTSIATLNAANNSADSWLMHYNLSLRNANNALNFYVGGAENERTAMIQAGHYNNAYAQYLGVLHLNKLGGAVYINNQLAATQTWVGDNYVKKSGDTMTGLLTIKNANYANQLTIFRDNTEGNSVINFQNTEKILGRIGVCGSAGTYPYHPLFTDANGYDNKIWHSGNDGENSGLDADKLDGVHNGHVTAKLINGTNAITTTNITTPGFYYFDGNPANIADQSPTPGNTWNFSMIVLGHTVSRTKQLALEYSYGRLYSRINNDSGWSGWKAIAFTTDNVASASRLATTDTYKAWGRPFFANGVPNSISGDMTGVGSITMSGNLNMTAAEPSIQRNGENVIRIADAGLVIAPYSTSGFIALRCGNKTNTSGATELRVLNNGNVGIKTPYPAYDLDVNGTAKVTTLKIGSITLSDGGGYLLVDKTIVSSADVQAFGQSDTSGGGGGAAFNLLTSWSNYSADKDNSYAISAGLGYDLYNNKLSKAQGDSYYQPKGNYLTSHQSLANYLYAFGQSDFDPATYDGYYAGMTTKSGIDTNWWHILSMNWGTTQTTNNKTWASQLALPTQTRRGLRYRTATGATAYSDWVTVIDSSNYSGVLDDRYVKKSGDTMTGLLTIKNANYANQLTIFRDNTEGNSVINFQNTEKILGRIGVCGSAGTYPYHPLFTDANGYDNKIWHSGNDGTGSGLDADLLDGLHHTAFARADQSPTVDLNTVNGIGMLCNPANANATTERHYPIAEAGCLIYCTAAYSSANQIYGSYFSNRWFARGGGSTADSKTTWREFAFLDSNVASATNADKLDEYHETAFFRQNRGQIPTAYIDITDYNSGAAGYANYAPGTYQIPRGGHSDLFVNLAHTNGGSTSALQFMTNFAANANLYFRKTIDSNRVSGAWTTILTNLNIGSYNAGSATKLQTARSINGTSFDGTGDITTAKWGTARTIWINDNSSAHWGTATGIDGSGNINLYLPSDCDFTTLAATTLTASTANIVTANIKGVTSFKLLTATNSVSFEPQANGNLNLIGHTSAGANPSIGAFDPSNGQLSIFKLYIGTALYFDGSSTIGSSMAIKTGETLWLNTARTIGFRIEGNVVRLIGATLIADKDIQAFSV